VETVGDRSAGRGGEAKIVGNLFLQREGLTNLLAVANDALNLNWWYGLMLDLWLGLQGNFAELS
jgi:hypothetical protein